MLIEPLGSKDVPSLLELLERHQLPTHGISDTTGFFVVRVDGHVIGSVGVETYGETGLLRSLVVEAAQRGTGIASALVARAVRHATLARLQALVLLTTTAPGFFEKHGFTRCPRSEAPAGIRDSWAFQTGCPDSAIFMRRWLAPQE
jgi:amino-acid N-acetyltransferase